MLCRFLNHIDFYDFLDNLATARTRRVELVQSLGAVKAGQEVRRSPVDYVAVSWPHPTKLTRLQQSLGLDLHVHVQAVLTVPSHRELLFPGESGQSRALALGARRWERAVSCGVGGEDDRVGHRAAAVRHVDARVAVVVFVVVGGEGRGACWDVGHGEGMGEAGHVLVPVLAQGPAADAVFLMRCVELTALRALPRVLGGDLRVGVVTQTLGVFVWILLHLFVLVLPAVLVLRRRLGVGAALLQRRLLHLHAALLALRLRQEPQVVCGV